MSEQKLPLWGEKDIPELLTLEQIGEDRWRSRYGDPNLNGRSYGGQVLGQAMMAASLGVPQGRDATLLQYLFLQGAMPDESIDFEVKTVQEGKRFTSRHVHGYQGNGRLVLDAQATFALPLDAPEHQSNSRGLGEEPEGMQTLADVKPEWEARLRGLGGYSVYEKPSMVFRVPDLDRQVSPEHATPSLRFWLKARYPLPAGNGMHASTFAYLSDWWVNFAALAGHMRNLDESRRLYISSLNHSIWFHRPFAADEWMHFDCESPAAANGRGLSIARIHNRAGQLVASVTQECLMAYA